MTEQGIDYTKPASQLSETTRLVGQPRKMINFIRKKISDYMEPNILYRVPYLISLMKPTQPTFTIPSQTDKRVDPLPYSCNPGRPAQRL